MARYDKFQQKAKPRPAANPIWRGIGCILMVVVPLISFGLALIAMPPLIATGYVPLELMGHVPFPAWVTRVPILNIITDFIAGINNLWLGVIVFLVILLLLSGVFSLFYVAFMQVVGPPRYGEMDAPPPRYKAKPYKR
jgi:hypothetical protein